MDSMFSLRSKLTVTWSNFDCHSLSFPHVNGFPSSAISLGLCYFPFLVVAVHAVFTFILVTQQFAWRSPRRCMQSPRLRSMHRKATWICVGLFCICGLLLLLDLFTTPAGSWKETLLSSDVVLTVTHAVAWLCICVALQVEHTQGRAVYAKLLGSWWVASLVLDTMALGTVMKAPSISYAVLVFLPFTSSLFFVVIYFAGYLYGGIQTPELESAKVSLLSSDLLLKESTIDAPSHSGFSGAGLLSVLTFSWLNPVLRTGNRKPLLIGDVPLLDPADDANRNFKAFKHSWERQILNSTPGTLPYMPWILLRAFWRPFIVSILLTIVWSCTMFVGPILQYRLIKFMEEENRTFSAGVALVSILLAGKFLEALSVHQLQFRSRKLGLQMWAGVGCAVYKKSLRLSLKAKQTRSVGEITNLLSNDVKRLLDLQYYIQQGLALPLQILIAVIILFEVVGVAMVAGLSILVLVLIINTFIIRTMRASRSRLLEAKDKRMQATTECLSNMKVIKLQAWDEMFKEKIENRRERERRWVQAFLHSWALIIWMVWTGPLAVSAVTFITMVVLGISLTTARVFTALTTFRIIQEPIRFLPDIISNIIQSTVSLQRIRAFLLEDEVDESAVERTPDTSYAVEIEGATFSWDKLHTELAIKDLSLKISKGTCVAICGGVGSGKSTLLYCILGELPKLSGSAKLSGRIAYVAQTAWIQNNSIRENILFGSAMDWSRYKEAIRVSGLEPDLAQFPSGDETEIGERGLNLSGGQKQRVQLARAVYKDADIYLLDDPFSAVDAHTGTFLFEECVKGALKYKTVILVTHQVEFLPAADQIIVMRAPGEIVQKGTYSELVQEGKDLGSFVEALQNSLHSVTQARQDKQAQDVLLDSQSDAVVVRSVSNGSRHIELLDRPGSPQGNRSASSLVRPRKGSSEIADVVESKRPNNTKLIQEEIRAVGRVDRQIFWAYLTKVYRGVFCIIIATFQVLMVAGQVTSDAWLAWGTSGGRVMNLRFLEGYVGWIALCSMSVFVRTNLVAFTGLATSQAFFSDMLNCVIRAPMSFIDSTPIGRILARASSDQSTLDLELPNFTAGVGNCLAQLTGSILISTYVTPGILVVVIPLGFLYRLLQVYYITSSRELSRLNSLTEAPLFIHISESIAGATTIRAFVEQTRFSNTNDEVLEANQRAFFHNLTAKEWLGLRLDCLAATVLSCSALLLITLPQDSVAAGMAGMSLSYGLSLSGVMMRFVNSTTTVENKMVSVERIAQYSAIPSEAPSIIADRRPEPHWPNAGRIELQNLQVRYRSDAPLVLKGISCVIHPREKVGVVGRTGSGKSTLIQALFRLIEPAGGCILIDGLDITTIGLHDLRSALSVIPQEPTLFEGSVRSNLDPFNMYSDEQLWEAIEKCRLGQVVRDKPQKLDASVSEQGENWSVGERQLLCLGRALLKKARILVLDEATASVDITTDAVIQQTIRQYFADSTVISVAHRIPTVIDSDRVLVFNAGYLMENNSPEHLTANETSMFSKLVQEYEQRAKSSSNLDELDSASKLGS